MDNQFEGQNNQDISKMNSEQKLEVLKTQITGRDSKGRFTDGHSGNPKGRPPAKRTLDGCLNQAFAQKTTINVNGKALQTTMLQAACYKLMASALSSSNPKLLLKFLKDFGPMINLSEELPPPKIKPYKEDPTVQMIKNAIFNHMDEAYGVSNHFGDENNLIE